MKTKKRFLSIPLSLALILGLMMGMSITAYAADNLTLNAGTSSSGTGWSWDGTNKVLTLNGADIDGYVWIGTDAKIIVTSNTQNTIRGGYTTDTIGGADTHGSATGIYCSGSLSIEGAGQLSVSSTDNSPYKDDTPENANTGGVQKIYGIYCSGDFIVDGTTLVSEAGSTTYVTTAASADGSFGIYCGGDLTFKNGSNITAIGGKALNTSNGAASLGIVVADGKTMTVSGENTKLTARASDARACSFAIKGGTGYSDQKKTGIDLTIDGATVRAIAGKSTKSASSCASEGIFVGDLGTLTLESGNVYCESSDSVYGSYGFRCRGNLIIKGGILEVQAGKSQKNQSYGIYAGGSSASVTKGYGIVQITGGLIASSADDGAIRAENKIDMTVSEELTLYNENETFTSGTTKVLTQKKPTAPLRIGEVQYEVSVSNDGRGTATADGKTDTGMIPKSQAVNLVATPNDNYMFHYWTVNGTKSTAIKDSNAQYTVNSSDGDAEIKAFFKPSVPLTEVSISSLETAVTGSVLSAAMTPADALDVSYQWYRGDTEIDGATGADYTITADDIDQTIKVVVTQYGYETPVTGEISIALPKETTPAATFTATGADCGMLSGLVDGAQYALTGATPATFTASGTTQALTGISAGKLTVVRKGNGTTKADSDAQEITVTQPGAPEAGKVDCASADNNDGKLTGVTAAMEYKKSDAESWAAGTGSDITGLAPGTYYVRVKASGTALASVNQELTIEAATGKPAASVTKAPEAKTLTYNGSAQELIAAGEAEGGTMQYALGENATTAPTTGYTTSIPTAANAGTYTVWYMLKGDRTHADSVPACVKVTIAPKQVGLKWANTRFTYNGKSHVPTATATGLVGSDKCKVTVTGAQTKAGTYKATASKLSNANYKLPSKKTQSFTIAKASQKAPSAPVVTAVSGDSITVKAVSGQQYKISGGNWQTGGTLTGLSVGKSYTIYTRKPGDANHTASPASAGTKARTLSAAILMQTDTKVRASGKTITARWGKVPGATDYDIYVQYCGTAFDSSYTGTTKNLSITIREIGKKPILTGKNYKVVIVARKGNTELGRTVELHGVASGRQSRYADPTAVNVSKTSLALTRGKSVTLSASVTPKTGQLSDSHGTILRYVTSDSSVATVDANGKITAKGAGICTIQVIARNGLSKSVTVTVK